jgi:hypothetical protein
MSEGDAAQRPAPAQTEGEGRLGLAPRHRVDAGAHDLGDRDRVVDCEPDDEVPEQRQVDADHGQRPRGEEDRDDHGHGAEELGDAHDAPAVPGQRRDPQQRDGRADDEAQHDRDRARRGRVAEPAEQEPPDGRELRVEGVEQRRPVPRLELPGLLEAHADERGEGEQCGADDGGDDARAAAAPRAEPVEEHGGRTGHRRTAFRSASENSALVGAMMSR